MVENDAWRVAATFQGGRWRATLTDKKTGKDVHTKPLQGIEPHAHLELHVGDDGGFAVLDARAEHRSIDRLLVYDASGSLRASLGIRDILTPREQAGVMRSESHITWLQRPPEAKTCAEHLHATRSLRLTTLANRHVIVSLADGSIAADTSVSATTPAGPRTLGAEAAAAAAALRTGRLTLSRYTAIDAGGAKALAAYSGQDLILDGLTTLDTDAAREIAAFKGSLLDLSGLTGLDARTAGALATFAGSRLELRGLTTLDADAARALADLGRGWLSLAGLQRLDAGVAAGLARFKGEALILSGVATLDADAARAIGQFTGRHLNLDGLKTIDAETAAGLAAFAGSRLDLNGVATIDAAAARAISAFKGQSLLLSGLTTLGADAARALAASPAWNVADLPNLTAIDAATAALLAAHKSDVLRLQSVAALSPDTAKVLAGFRGQELNLAGLTKLDAATAKALARYKGFYVRLNGLQEVDAEVAAELAAFAGVQLDLSGLTTLPPDVAEALARSKCSLALNGLQTLSDEAAQALSRFQGSQLSLNGLRNPSVATAEALVAFPSVVTGFLQALCEERPLTLDRARVLRVCTRQFAEHQKREREQPPPAELRPVTLAGLNALDTPDAVAIARLLAGAEVPLVLRNLSRVSPKTLSALLESDTIEIPLIEDLELIKEPDGSPTDDFVVPERLLQRQERQRRGE